MNKEVYWKQLLGVLLTLVVIGLASCINENLENRMMSTDSLNFSISISDKWINGTNTRSFEQSLPETEPYQFNNSNLWLITSTTPNNDTSLFNIPKEQTRATTQTNTNFYSSFSVYAYVYTGNDWDAATDRKIYINGDNATKTNDIWSCNPARFWPGSEYNMKFYAFAPHNLDISWTNETPTISYTVNTDAKQQKDILAATTETPGKKDGSLELEFQHLLTAINITATDHLNRTITKVKFSGIKSSGTYTLGNTTWTPTGNDTEISCILENGTQLNETTPVDIISDSDGTTFMMIPQILGSNAKIEVTFDNGETLSAPLVGEWIRGTRHIYKVSATSIVWEYLLETNIMNSFYYDGETVNQLFNVLSCKTKGNNESRISVPWSAKFVREITDGDGGVTYEEIMADDSDYPNWIEDITTESDDSFSIYEVYSGTAKADPPINKHLEKLKNAQSINITSGKTPYNLSSTSGNNTLVERTANCYIVNAPGTYSFPLVYGNAIDIAKNPAYPFYNTSAYISSATGEYALENFVNHTNAAITDPYIANNSNCIPTDAVLVWQDSENLVSNIQFIDGGSAESHRITFDVQQSYINEGNAIIAIRNANGTIMWSWHIWVTDYVPFLTEITPTYDPSHTQKDKLVQSYDKLPAHTYTTMGVPLGWCNANHYKGNSVLMQFTQAESGKTAIIEVRQQTTTFKGDAPYYQWGRKDPMLPFGRYSFGEIYKDQKTHYTDYSNYKFAVANVSSTIGTAIQNPNVLYWYLIETSNWSWCDINGTIYGKTSFINLWDADNTIFYGNTPETNNYIIGEKTIYDPSPAGYIIPPNGAMNGSTYNGKNAPSSSFGVKYNSPYTAYTDVNTNRGWILYCNGMNSVQGPNGYDKSGGVIFIPGLSNRGTNTGTVITSADNNDSVYHSNTTSAPNRTISVSFYSYINTQGRSGWALGAAVRPIRE